MHVKAVVVHFEHEDRTRKCLESLKNQEGLALPTVLVDHSPLGFSGEAPVEHTVRPVENGGFGAGVRAGVEAGEPAEVILLLNPDAVAQPGWARAMVQAVQASPRTGMAACRVLHSQRGCLDSAGLGLSRGGLGLLRGHGLPAESTPRRLERVPLLGPTGAAAAYRTALLEELGGFPREYFLYYEDLEVAFRARRRGWDCAWVDDALVHHAHQSSAGSQKTYYLRRAQRLFLRRNWPDSWSRRYRPYLWAAQAGAVARGMLRGTLPQVLEAHREVGAMEVAPLDDPLPSAEWLAARP